MIARSLLICAAAIALSGCEYAREALDYGKGPFDGSPAVTSEDVFSSGRESAWASTAAQPAEGAVLYVTNKRGNDLSVVDLKTGKETARVPTCFNPHELAVSPAGSHLAVGCYGGTTVDIFTTDDLAKVASVELGENARPHGIIWHKSGAIFATAEGRKSIIRVVDPLSSPKVTEFTTNQDGSHMLAVAPDLRWAWTTDLGSRTVTRIDLEGDKPPLSVEVGDQPEGISLTPDGKRLWVSARGSNQAFALDPVSMEVRKTLDTGRFPLRLAIRPQGDIAVTSDLMDGALSVIDLQTKEMSHRIKVSSPEEASNRLQVTLLWSDDGKRIYVAETGSNTVAEVDFASRKVLRRFTVGEGGDGLAILTPRSER